jgi:hypothetical protein
MKRIVIGGLASAILVPGHIGAANAVTDSTPDSADNFP